MLGLCVFSFSASTTLAQEETPGAEEGTVTEENTILSEPVQKQIIQLTDEGTQDDWGLSKLETYGLKFLVRGKDALTWSLSIDDSGFHNEAIEKSYLKVLTIVNSLFVLGLLAIAVMWMFSILIPRKYLKKVILIYSLAVIFVNFALPVNQLFIDGTNLLQKTLMTEKDGSIQITDIVQTPAYSEVLSYQNQGDGNMVDGKQTDSVTLKLDGAPEETTSIGKIRSAQGETITEEAISLNNQKITLLTDSPFSIHQEETLFRFILLLATGTAYFTIALIFVLRIVILWALLILSPMLLLLAIFSSTRGWFYNWLSMYGRWLLIGPLTALGIAVIVNIWQLSGLPITVDSAYTPDIFSAEKISNIVFYLPGKDTPNTLSNTQEMMEYIIFLIMLYLPVFLGFALTKRKILHESLLTISKSLSKSTQTTQQQLISKVLAIQEKEEEKRDRPAGIMDSFRRLVNDKIGFLTEAAMPMQRIKTSPVVPLTMMPTASNFLPDNLQKTPVPKMLELLGQQKDSKTSHRQMIERLARTEKMTDRKEKEKVMAVMNEIEGRAQNNDREAMAILHEVETIKETDIRSSETAPAIHIQTEEAKPETSSSISINVNEARPEADRKVRDSSMDSKGKEKNKKKQDEKKKTDEQKDGEETKGEKKAEENAGNEEQEKGLRTKD